MSDVPIAHLLVKVLNKAEVSFPSTKQEILVKVDTATISPNATTTIPVASIIDDLIPEEYPSGAAFMAALYNYSYRRLWETAQAER